MKNTSKIFLIDAMALIYRAYFAFMKSPRVNEKGMNTGAILGFANSLVEVLHNQQPSHIAVAFDTAAPTFRQKIYEAYKAHREAQPEDITLAIPYIKQLLEAFHIPCITKEGYEADDLIGTLAHKLDGLNFEVYLMTPDKDFAQLVKKHIHLYRPGIAQRNTTIWQEAEVLQAWGIDHPSQVTDILGLWGDASDNIPGVPNIGQKTAQKLIKQFGSIENLLKNTQSLTARLQENLTKHAQQALLSKQLATICTTVPIDFDIESSKYTGPDAEKIMTLCNELGFRQLPKRILHSHKQVSSPIQISLFPNADIASESAPVEQNTLSTLQTLEDIPHAYHLIEDVQKCQTLLTALQAVQTFAFDTETTGINPMQARLIGLSIAYKSHEAYYINLNTAQSSQLLDLLKPVFLDPKKEKIGQNLKYDLHVLQQHGIKVQPPFFDTMVAHHLLHPDARHNLNDMARNHLSYQPIPIENLIGQKGKKQQICMSNVPIEQLTDYACEDADVTLQLYEKFKSALLENNLVKLFKELEMPLLPVLLAMESAGIAIDSNALAETSAILQQEMQALREAIYTLADETFNLDSPKQLGPILFDKLKLVEKPTQTKSGQYNTSQAILTKLTNHHPIIPKILAYRELKKLTSTYIDALPTLVSSQDNRLHTSYHQTHVYTGRLSSSYPNLQNIPIRTEKGRSIRKAFIASHPDYCLLAADYSQIELRLMAHFADDTSMIEAFQAGKDIHAATASKIFQTDPEHLKPNMRRQAKMVNFGIIYGISAFGLAQRLEIPRKQAQEIIQAYFKEFPTIKAYMEKTIEQVRKQGFVTTLWGRKRFFPHINSRNATLRGMEERAAINMPIQGSAAELIKKAMIAIHAWQKQENLPFEMLMQVHDELVFEVHKSVLDTFKKNIKNLMQEALQLKVPIVVDVGVGKNWFEAH